ncbi:hypothetical protein RQP46_000523 [Phenoliferia psychrophenolica]
MVRQSRAGRRCFLLLLPTHTSAMPFESIPLRTELAKVYTPASLLQQGERWASLASAFEASFSTPLQKIARAPGRVNVIGEHIDYCGFSVFPAAIERDVLVAFAVPSPSAQDARPPPAAGRSIIHLRNVDPAFSPCELEVDLSGTGSELLIKKPHHWSNYFIAGSKGMLEFLHAHPALTNGPTPPPHVYIMVTGSVPLGSGLSSSAAITTASVVAILELAGRRDGVDKVGRRDVTNVAIESERLVGVNSGGMDQSASVFSKPLNLLHIEFIPSLLATPIPLPHTVPGLSLVIANTLVTSSKALTAKYHYNLRVVETRLGARLLARHLGVPVPSKGEPQLSFKTVMDLHFASKRVEGGEGDERTMSEIRAMLEEAGKALGGEGMEKGVGWDEVCSMLGEERKEVEEEVVGDQEVEPVGGKLKLWTRARHVFSEALRVYQFKDLIQAAEDGSVDLLHQLGALMNESQESCRDDFECSCPEINDVVQLALANGALGSRVTGAGWGGATVSLVPEPQVPAFIAALRAGYYAKKFPNLSAAELDDACFATKPEAGACLFVQTP